MLNYRTAVSTYDVSVVFGTNLDKDSRPILRTCLQHYCREFSLFTQLCSYNMKFLIKNVLLYERKWF